MRPIVALSVLSQLVALAPLAWAQPDVVLVSAADGAVDAGEVQELLRVELPGLRVSTDSGEDAAGVARVTVATWPDGRLAVSFRDATGRETVRLVDPGDRPAATIAMIVVNLQEDQLDSVLGTPGSMPAPPPVEPAPGGPRVRATVRPAAPSPEALSLGAGFGLMQRSLAVEVAESSLDRTYLARYPTIALAAEAFPARLFGDRGPLSWLGLGLSFERALAIDTTGIDASTSEAIEIASSYQDVAASVLFDAPLGSAARLRLAAGWREVDFELDPFGMLRLDPAVQVPSFRYAGFVASAGLEGHLGETGLTARGTVVLHAVQDVGQAVRDLYGADTEGATGLAAQASLSGWLIPRLRWSAAVEVRQYATEPRGPSSIDGGRIGGFPSAVDRYLSAVLGLAYRLD